MASTAALFQVQQLGGATIPPCEQSVAGMLCFVVVGILGVKLLRANRAVIEELLWPDIVFHTDGTATVGPEAFYPFFDRMQAAFSDIHISVHDAIAENDKVCLRGSGTMRHTGEGLGVPPTDDELNISGISIVRISNSRVEGWQHWDRFRLEQFVSNAESVNSYAAPTAHIGMFGVDRQSCCSSAVLQAEMETGGRSMQRGADIGNFEQMPILAVVFVFCFFPLTCFGLFSCIANRVSSSVQRKLPLLSAIALKRVYICTQENAALGRFSNPTLLLLPLIEPS